MVDDLLALYLKATSFWLFLVEFDNAFGEIAVGILVDPGVRTGFRQHDIAAASLAELLAFDFKHDIPVPPEMRTPDRYIRKTFLWHLEPEFRSVVGVHPLAGAVPVAYLGIAPAKDDGVVGAGGILAAADMKLAGDVQHRIVDHKHVSGILIADSHGVDRHMRIGRDRKNIAATAGPHAQVHGIEPTGRRIGENDRMASQSAVLRIRAADQETGTDLQRGAIRHVDPSGRSVLAHYQALSDIRQRIPSGNLQNRTAHAGAVDIVFFRLEVEMIDNV